MAKRKQRSVSGERAMSHAIRRALALALVGPAAMAAFACSDDKATSHQSSAGGGATTGPSSASSGSMTEATGATSTSATSTSSGMADGGDSGGPCAPQDFTPNPPDDCGAYRHLPCGVPPVMIYPGCYFSLGDCAKICDGILYFNCHVVDTQCSDAGMILANADGSIDVDCSTCNKGPGRASLGLAPARVRGSSALGRHFARAAYFEGASVVAFERLLGELAAHGAPLALRRRARRASRDEVRHAQTTTRLARRFGGRPAEPRFDAFEPRALFEVALENVVEGCVNETFEALVASYQSETAKDPEVASAMASIARDEARHAALAWSVAHWISTKLDDDQRAAVDAAGRRALAALKSPQGEHADDAARALAGLPDAGARLRLVEAFATLFDELPSELLHEVARA